MFSVWVTNLSTALAEVIIKLRLQDYTHPDDQTTVLHVTPGFKPFTVSSGGICISQVHRTHLNNFKAISLGLAICW